MGNVTDPKRFMHLATKQQCVAAAEMANDIKAVVYKHADTIPVALAIGVLRIVEYDIIKEQK